MEKSLSEVLLRTIIMNVPSDYNAAVPRAFLWHIKKWNGLSFLAKEQYLLKILKLTN